VKRRGFHLDQPMTLLQFILSVVVVVVVAVIAIVTLDYLDLTQVEEFLQSSC